LCLLVKTYSTVTIRCKYTDKAEIAVLINCLINLSLLVLVGEQNTALARVESNESTRNADTACNQSSLPINYIHTFSTNTLLHTTNDDGHATMFH